MQETQVQSLGWQDPLGKEIATNSSILVWEISWTEEPGGLQSMGSQRVTQALATEISNNHVVDSLGLLVVVVVVVFYIVFENWIIPVKHLTQFLGDSNCSNVFLPSLLITARIIMVAIFNRYLYSTGRFKHYRKIYAMVFTVA